MVTHRHNERCKNCKIRVEQFLKLLYGEAIGNHNLDLPAKVDDYAGSKFETELSKIHVKLQKYRGHKIFVKSKKLPNVDYFIPKPGFIVEFDESQHFTKPRGISLSGYPKHMPIGFNLSKWTDLCCNLNKKDNDPPYRDEQRAWYDTLRDFAPSLLALQPTIRLFAKDFVWCSLHPDSEEDIEKFQQIMQGKYM